LINPSGSQIYKKLNSSEWINPIPYKKVVVLGKEQNTRASNVAIWHK
jgi:hypothetical protein